MERGCRVVEEGVARRRCGDGFVRGWEMRDLAGAWFGWGPRSEEGELGWVGGARRDVRGSFVREDLEVDESFNCLLLLYGEGLFVRCSVASDAMLAFDRSSYFSNLHSFLFEDLSYHRSTSYLLPAAKNSVR